jgi:hypothetical protein
VGTERIKAAGRKGRGTRTTTAARPTKNGRRKKRVPGIVGDTEAAEVPEK